MKKIFDLVLLGFVMILACKQTSNTENPVKSADVNTATEKWTNDQNEEFLKNCNGFLDNEGVDNAAKYCDCLLDATKKAHPDPETAAALEQNDIVSLFEESGCLDDYLMVKIEDPWTEEVSAAFIENCTAFRVESGADSASAEAYCSCALEKVKALIPQPQHLIQLTQEELNNILKDCN